MSTTHHRTFADDSDDEIVWSLSDRREPRLALTPSPSCSLVSDFSSDFVIVSNPLSPVLHANPSIPYGSQSRSPTASPQHSPITTISNVPLTKQVVNLRISGNPKGSTKNEAKKAKPALMQNDENQPASTKKQQKQAKKARKAKRKLATPADAYPSPSPSPRAQKTAAKAPPKEREEPRGNTNAKKSTVPRGSTDVRPVVPTTTQAAEVPSLYEEASTFISRFLSNPEAKNDSVCRLTLLQSLIIELGLATSNLPASLKSARAFLKARAFLNIREYITVRSQGPDAIQKAMYPSKTALIKNFKKNKRNKAPLQWVKDMGLQVLLVGWMH